MLNNNFMLIWNSNLTRCSVFLFVQYGNSIRGFWGLRRAEEPLIRWPLESIPHHSGLGGRAPSVPTKPASLTLQTFCILFCFTFWVFVIFFLQKKVFLMTKKVSLWLTLWCNIFFQLNNLKTHKKMVLAKLSLLINYKTNLFHQQLKDPFSVSSSYGSGIGGAMTIF